MVTKTCVSCAATLPATTTYFFYRNKAKGWFSSWCKSCAKRHRVENMPRELYLQRKRRPPAPCKDCGTVHKPLGAMFCANCLSMRKKAAKKVSKCLYKSRLRKAMPAWADKDALRRIYAATPTGCEVDHIVPIRSKRVCGLHVPANLRYLPAAQNREKSNKLIEELL